MVKKKSFSWFFLSWCKSQISFFLFLFLLLSFSLSLFFFWFLIIPLFGSFTYSLAHSVMSTQLDSTHHTHTQVTTTTTTPGTPNALFIRNARNPIRPRIRHISTPSDLPLPPTLDVSISCSNSIISLLLFSKTAPFSHEDCPGMPKIEHYQCW